TQAMTVQVTEKNKEGACLCTNKKRKAEESEEREKSRKMLKHKKEIPQNASVKLAEAPIVDNEDTSKQSWAEMIDKDSDNLKNIANATNPWAFPSTSETNIDENACEPNLYPDHAHENMQTEAAPYETKAESKESAINDRNTHEEKAETHLTLTQATTVQVTEKNKIGACPRTNKKRKAEESEESEESRKMLKHKEETPQNASVKAPVVDNKNTSKQSWPEIMDNDSDNLKDITNTTNPWAFPNTSETNIEYTNTENDILHDKKEEAQLGKY
ncbi:10671_t:CDS:2, partial [Gigaspora margarita]